MHVFLMSAKNIATFIDEIAFHDSKLERKSGQQNMNACPLLQKPLTCICLKFRLIIKLECISSHWQITHLWFPWLEFRASKGRFLIHVYISENAKKNTRPLLAEKTSCTTFFYKFSFTSKKRIQSDNIQRPKHDRNSLRENQQKFVLTKHFFLETNRP